MIESLMNLENHGEMFLEPSACMDIGRMEGGREGETVGRNACTDEMMHETMILSVGADGSWG